MMQAHSITKNPDGNKTDIHCLGKILTVNYTFNDMKRAFEIYEAGAMIQTAFHFLTATEREFMMTGMTPKEQEAIFGKDDE